MHHTQTRHAPTLPRDEITRADPLTGDESDDALLRMPFKEARAAAIDTFEELRAPPARAHTTQRVQSRAPRGH
jgi:hypothetical protein